MIQENEVVMLMLGLGILVFFAMGRLRIREFPEWRVFLLGYAVLNLAWVCTVLEGFLWGDALNLLEHLCYAASSVLVAVWFWRVLGRRKAAA